VTLSLQDLPTHEEVTVEFDLYIIDSWNGNATSNGPDVITIDLIGAGTLLNTTFSNHIDDPQAFPGDYPSGNNARGAGAAAIGSLGYPDEDDSWGDATYRLTYTVPHSAATLTLRVTGNPNASGETWGIDNVRLTVK
jgi:hypothetical protein